MNTESIQPAREVISGFLKSRREEMNLSADQLAEKVGVTRSTIWRVENGKFWPRLDLLLRICNELDCNFSLRNKKP